MDKSLSTTEGKTMLFIKKVWWDIWINGIGGSFLVPDKIRYYIYKFFGLNTQTRWISHSCVFNSPNIEIKQGTFLNSNVYIDCTGGVTIEENVDIAFDVSIFTATHKVNDSGKRAGEGLWLPLVIGQGTWVGARATILPGVTIGEGCIIGAGSLVNKDCEPNSLYAGVPARRIKDLPI